MRSGKTFLFKFEAKGYYTVYKRIKIKRFQNRIKLSIHMSQRPGTLLISSETKGITLLINNSSKYLTGGKKRRLRRIPPIPETRPTYNDIESWTLFSHYQKNRG